MEGILSQRRSSRLALLVKSKEALDAAIEALEKYERLVARRIAGEEAGRQTPSWRAASVRTLRGYSKVCARCSHGSARL